MTKKTDNRMTIQDLIDSKRPRLNRRGRMVFEACVYFEWPKGFDNLSLQLINGVTFLADPRSSRPWDRRKS